MNKFILDSLSTAVLVFDRQLRLQYMNTAAENLLDTSFQQANHHFISEIFSSKGSWIEEIRQTFNNAAPFTRRQVELQLATSFRHIVVDYTVSPILEGQMMKQHQAADVQQVLMEINSLDRVLRISREETLLSTEQTSRTLVRGLAHEIKNPLGGIRGAAQLLSRELSDQSLKDYTTVIIEEADRLRNLVDRMLGINRPLRLESLNVHEVLERVAALIEVETAGSIHLVRDYDPSIPNIRGDREQLIQVVLNIVRNAMQALTGNKEKGTNTPNPKIILRTRTKHHFTIGQKQHRLVCRIDIIDNGPGIPADIAQNMFYPLISGRPEGTGLGLSIAQSIVIQHQGLIQFTSAVTPAEASGGASHHSGTTFSIYLPLDK
jgi:two-component system nitrogen regulation sensor histidine kinase GlnL